MTHRDEWELRRFIKMCLDGGWIPGPTDINRQMGWSGGNNLQRAWAVRVRTEMFEAHGLVKRGPRWSWA